MTENEAIYVLEMNRPFAYSELQEALDVAIDNLEEIQQYRAIGTVEEFKVLKEKSVPKIPLHQGFIFACPRCNDYVTVGSVFLRPNQNYCIDCGQKLDWE